jgi:hypothetical protein
VSLLLANGHVAARQYPVVMAWSEARIIRQRIAAGRKLDAALMQQVLSSMFSKEAGKALQQTLGRMDESE